MITVGSPAERVIDTNLVQNYALPTVVKDRWLNDCYIYD